MLNVIWLLLLVAGVVLGATSGHLKEITDEAFNGAKTAVISLALPLIGITSFWLGMMRLAEKAGLIASLARLLRPVMRRLFPDVPPEHPAMGSMLMNFAANMLGLNNAATPLGLRAMGDLEKLNRNPGTATNAMCTFLAINTSSIQLLPTTAIGILAAAGSHQPTAIVGTALLASICTTTVGITAVKLLEKLPWFGLPSGSPPTTSPNADTSSSATTPQQPNSSPSPAQAPSATSADAKAPTAAASTQPAPLALASSWRTARTVGVVLMGALFLLVNWQLISAPSAAANSNPVLRIVNALSLTAIPLCLLFFPVYAWLSRVPVYEEFVEGAKEGFHVAVRIIPFLVAMLVAVGVFRAAGGVAAISRVLDPVLSWIQFPSELLPMALMRPLSGSGTIGLFADLVKTYGPDHLLSRMGATLLGSTETTLYVIAVYFGSVAVRRGRHAIAAGLLADLAGMLASAWICRLVFH